MSKKYLLVLFSCVLFLLIPAPAFLAGGAGPSSQDKVLSSNPAESFEMAPMQEKLISLDINGPGRLSASVLWSGGGALNMTLTGPGQDAPYARR